MSEPAMIEVFAEGAGRKLSVRAPADAWEAMLKRSDGATLLDGLRAIAAPEPTTGPMGGAPETVYVVGRLNDIGNAFAKIHGVFSSLDAARGCCADARDFVGPLTLDKVDRGETWAGLECPMRGSR